VVAPTLIGRMRSSRVALGGYAGAWGGGGRVGCGPGGRGVLRFRGISGGDGDCAGCLCSGWCVCGVGVSRGGGVLVGLPFGLLCAGLWWRFVAAWWCVWRGPAFGRVKLSGYLESSGRPRDWELSGVWCDGPPEKAPLNE